ncbi:MAG: MtrAB system histidine kinase MtrB [Promicromonosporaceae bacterium]|nr:MtrAB system histidine kinase MtrB [Promicromonosporaceae bacterium]
MLGRLLTAPGRWLRSAVHRWRSSLQLRVVTTALLIGVLTVGLLGSFLSLTVRNGLFEQRITEIDQEATRSASTVQHLLSNAVVDSAADVQQFVLNLVDPRLSGAASAHGTLLTAAGDVPMPAINDAATFREMSDLVSPELREGASSDALVWQSVQIPATHSKSGEDEPGVLFGSVVEVPLAGTFQLFNLYSLQPQQETLRFVQNTLAIGAATILATIGLLTWLVTRQTVRPVRRAASTAARLADGQLHERMPTRGYDELATLARSFNEMAASLQDQISQHEFLSKAQRRFVSDVSHELRTPLTTIRMASEMIYEARSELDAAAMRSAELLQQQLDRFEDLLADLLEISRFDAGAAMLDVEHSDLDAIVEMVVENAQPLAESKGVELQVTMPGEPATADMDARRVERILRNLVTNAIEHAEGRPVEVALAQDDDAVAVRVRDHGIGMTIEQVDHVFDRFWRADPARTRTTGGTGLGLAISREDARLHSGRLEAWGLPGDGASFRLTLPRRAGLPVDRPPLSLIPEDDVAAPPTPPRGVGHEAALAIPDLLPAPTNWNPAAWHRQDRQEPQ